MRFAFVGLTWLLRALRTRPQQPTAPPVQHARIDYHSVPPARPRRRHTNNYDDAA